MSRLQLPRALGAMGMGLTMLVVLTTPAAASKWSVPVHSGSSGQAHSQTTPSAPTSVTATCTSATSATVKIAWGSVSHAASYSVYDSTTSSSSGYALVASGVSVASWTSGTLASASYWFEVAVVVGSHWTSANSAAAGPRTISSGPRCV